jgi:hypothetical protein
LTATATQSPAVLDADGLGRDEAGSAPPPLSPASGSAANTNHSYPWSFYAPKLLLAVLMWAALLAGYMFFPTLSIHLGLAASLGTDTAHALTSVHLS